MLGALGKVRGWIPWNIFVGRQLVWLLLTAGPSSEEAEVAQALPSKILVISKEEDFRAVVTAAVGPQAVLLHRVIPSQLQGLVFAVLNSARLPSAFFSSLSRPFWINVFLSQMLYLLMVQICPVLAGLPTHAQTLQGCKDGAGSLLSPHGSCKVAFCLWMTLDINAFSRNTCCHISVHLLRNEKLWMTTPPSLFSMKEDVADNWVFAV